MDRRCDPVGISRYCSACGCIAPDRALRRSAAGAEAGGRGHGHAACLSRAVVPFRPFASRGRPGETPRELGNPGRP